MDYSYNEYNQNDDKKKNILKFFLGVFLGIFLILLAGFFYLMLRDRSEPELDLPEADEITIDWGDAVVEDEDDAAGLLKEKLSDSLDPDSISDIRWVETRTVDDETYYQYQQYYNGHPVYGSNTVIATDESNAVADLECQFWNILPPVVPEPTGIDQDKLMQAIRNYLASKGLLLDDQVNILPFSENDLVVHLVDQNHSCYAYIVTVENDGETYTLIVDADSYHILGEIIPMNKITNNELDFGRWIILPSEEVVNGIRECIAYLNDGTIGSSDLFRLIQLLHESGQLSEQEIREILCSAIYTMPNNCTSRHACRCVKKCVRRCSKKNPKITKDFLDRLDREGFSDKADFACADSFTFSLGDENGVVCDNYEVDVEGIYVKKFSGYKASDYRETLSCGADGSISLELDDGWYRLLVRDACEPGYVRKYLISVSGKNDAKAIYVENHCAIDQVISTSASVRVRDEQTGEAAQGWNLLVCDCNGNYFGDKDSLNLVKGYYSFIFSTKETSDHRQFNHVVHVLVSENGQKELDILLPGGCELSGHDWADATCVKPATCKICGETNGPLAEHNYSKATCEKPATCKICGATKGSLADHNYSKATCEKPATCKTCGKTTGKKAGHSWREATCTEPKTCTVCNKTEGGALGHDWADATYDAPSTCRRCGATQGSALSRVSPDGYYSWYGPGISDDGEYFSCGGDTFRTTAATEYIYTHCWIEGRPFEFSNVEIYSDNRNNPDYMDSSIWGEVNEYPSRGEMLSFIQRGHGADITVSNGVVVKIEVSEHV